MSLVLIEKGPFDGRIGVVVGVPSHGMTESLTKIEIADMESLKSFFTVHLPENNFRVLPDGFKPGDPIEGKLCFDISGRNADDMEFAYFDDIEQIRPHLKRLGIQKDESTDFEDVKFGQEAEADEIKMGDSVQLPADYQLKFYPGPQYHQKNLEELQRAQNIIRDLLKEKEFFDEVIRDYNKIRLDYEQLKMDHEDLEALNHFHVGEIEKGNQYREKQKETIAGIHDENHKLKDHIDIEAKARMKIEEEKKHIEADLKRFINIVDKLTAHIERLDNDHETADFENITSI